MQQSSDRTSTTTFYHTRSSCSPKITFCLSKLQCDNSKTAAVSGILFLNVSLLFVYINCSRRIAHKWPITLPNLTLVQTGINGSLDSEIRVCHFGGHQHLRYRMMSQQKCSSPLLFARWIWQRVMWGHNSLVYPPVSTAKWKRSDGGTVRGDQKCGPRKRGWKPSSQFGI